MMYKKLIFASLLILFLTLGTASAAEDMQSNQTLADDSGQEIIEVDDDSPDLQEEDSQDCLGEFVYGRIERTFRVDDIEMSSLANVYDSDYLNGNISLQIDDVDVFHKQFSRQDKTSEYYIMGYDLEKMPEMGIHKVNLTYKKIGVDAPYTFLKNVNFTFTFDIAINDDMNVDRAVIRYDEMLYVNVYVPDDAASGVTFKLDGKTVTSTKRLTLIFKEYEFKPGKHNLEIIFKDPLNRYPERDVTIPITVNPWVYSPLSMSYYEKDTIDIKAPKGTKITAALYDENQKTLFTKVSGVTSLSIPFADYLKKGDNNFFLSYTCNGFESGEYIYCNYFKNSNEVKVDVKKVGDSVKVTINAPKSEMVYIDVVFDDDGKIYESIEFKKGYFKKTLSGLSIGKHKVKVMFSDAGIHYSKTFFVTVKSSDKVSLTLNKVKVRKYAKSLVLKSTLKINKKAKKGLKVTFKFNGKKYKAKTNKKGVAKVTVKKNVLRKLKVGKTVKYQVTYSFKTVKKSVKVKR